MPWLRLDKSKGFLQRDFIDNIKIWLREALTLLAAATKPYQGILSLHRGMFGNIKVSYR